MCYGSGFGVDKDVVQAYKWATIAANHGYKDASELSEVLQKNATSEEIARAKREADEFSGTNHFQPPARQWPDIVTPWDVDSSNSDQSATNRNAEKREPGR